MRFESRTWFLLSLLLFAAAIYFWKRGNEYESRKHKPLPPIRENASTNRPAASAGSKTTPFQFLSRSALGTGQGNQSAAQASVAAHPANPAPAPALVLRPGHVLSNTGLSVNQLARTDSAILLRNAFIDTAQGTNLPIPAHLLAEGDPGSYIVQAHGPIQQAFRDQLREAGATVVSYIPNNAYLVQVSAQGAQQLAGQPETQAVLPYEPYYKLDTKLLALAVDQKPLGADQWLRVTAFPGGRDAVAQALTGLGGEVLAEERATFGPQLLVKATPDSLPAIAKLASVQSVEMYHPRELLNDQTRVVVGVSSDGATPSNYLGLTGTNVMVNMNDSGVDATHPDLQGRVFGDTPEALTDPFGHGTHVAGTLAGNGSKSKTVQGTPPGSGTNPNFRGIAPGVQILSLSYKAFPDVSRPLDDTYVQETAARTNAAFSQRRSGPMISNNSWGYVGANEYDSSSASFDAAARDAVPETPGSQGMIFVFAAGDSGSGTDQGIGGDPNTIPSPANAKNVIAVGALEQFRNITNAVFTTNTDGSLSTNAIFLGMTDSLDEVAAFSSRGNVGIGTEGDFGRFKPDLVAPGTFIISTRAKTWDLANDVDTNSPQYTILNELNQPLAPNYRYESGTSQAAPVVSGLLALMQEFFEQSLPASLRRTNSPALMKALLINGARSASPLYSLDVQNAINYQGWGLPNITNTLPALMKSQPEASWPVRFFDQSPTNALSTGQSKSWRLNLSSNAQDTPLRVTLVWTDPPGNPNAAIKLVNDLDLVVSNTVSGEIYYGNDIQTDSDYNNVNLAGGPVFSDVVNNVENVFISDPGSTNFVVTVSAKRVNVAAIPDANKATGQINDIVQDFALVIATADPTLTNAFKITAVTAPSPPQPVQATPMTNGVPLLNQRAGANSPLGNTRNGFSNQWSFYVFTNLFITNDISTMTNGTNVAFVTFLPPNVSRPRNDSADIDLYVSKDPGLVDLNPTTVDAAWKSLTRSGTEVVVFTNAALGDVFYIGVKSEDQQSGEFGLIALSSDQPFDENKNGHRILHGMPVPQNIPDGSPSNPGRATVFAIGITPITVQRVVASDILTHQDVGDLSIILSHAQTTVVLHNHTLNSGFGSPNVTNFLFTYDDQGFKATPGSRHSDGPGNLNNFAGAQGTGVWMANFVDSAVTQTGRVQTVTLDLTPFVNGDLLAAGSAGISGTVAAGDTACYLIDVPPEATNLVVSLSGLSNGPLEVYLSHGGLPTTNLFDKFALINPPGGDITLGADDQPFPLEAARYFVCLHNPTGASIDFHIVARIEVGVGLDFKRTLVGTNALSIPDGGLITSTVNVPVDKAVADVQVAVRIAHPRSSDLVLHLISPQGTRVLLAENRGGTDSKGYGAGFGTNISYTIFTENTNLIANLLPIKFALPPWTNLNGSTSPPTFFDGFENATNGTYITNQTLSGWTVAQGRVVVHTTGDTLGVSAQSGTNFAELDTTQTPAAITTSFGTVPGKDYQLSFFYQHNPDAAPGTPHALDVYYGPPADLRPPSKFIDVPNLAWQSTDIVFTATSPITQLEFGAITSVGPLLDTVTVSDVVVSTNIYVLPEESLDILRGERAQGDWTLEVWDDRLGPAGQGNGVLLGWELQLEYGNPAGRATVLTNGFTFSGIISTNQTNYFVVNVCDSAKVAFITLSGLIDTDSGFVNPHLNLLVNREGFPTGDPAKDDYAPIPNDLAIDDTTGIAAIQLDSNPHQPAPLQPGKQLFFAVHNLNPAETNIFDLQVSFDNDTCSGPRPIIRLENDIAYTNVVAPSRTLFDYYVFNVSPAAVEADFQVTPRNGDVGMVLRYGLPLPDLNSYDYRRDQPGITNELIVVTNTSTPMPLTPGDWYIGVYNNSTNVVVYDVRASEILDTNLNIIVLTNAIPLTFTIGKGAALTNYFLFDVRDPAPGVRFELFDLNTNADLFIGYNRLPSPTAYFSSNSASPSQPLTVEFQTNSTLPDVTGNWMLEVVNKDPLTNLVFTIRASVLQTNLLPSTNRVIDPAITVIGTNLCFSWPATAGLQYRLEGKKTIMDTNWTTLYGPVVATNTPMTYCLHLPTTYLFFQVVELGGGTPPPPPPPPAIIRLENDIPYTNVVAPSRTLFDYYVFNVSPAAVEADFQVTPRNGDVGMVLRYGLPLPDLSSFDYRQDQPGITNELIVLTNTSSPLPLLPGDWYIGVYNNSTSAVDYDVRASEVLDTNLNIINLTNAIPLTFTIGKGAALTNYFLFDVRDPSPDVRFELFNLNTNADLFVGYNLLPSLNAYLSSNSASPSQPLTLEIHTNSSLPDVRGNWMLEVVNKDPLTNLVFTIRASVLQTNLPPSTNRVINPAITVVGTNLCFSWPATAGLQYRLEGKKTIMDTNWTTLFGPVVATNTPMTFCLNLPSPYSFFQVIQNSGGASQPPPVTGTILDPALTFGTNGLCLSWPSQAGVQYDLQAKLGIMDTAWTNVATVTAIGPLTTRCLPKTTPYHFFQVVAGTGSGTSTGGTTNSVTLDVPALLADGRLELVWDAVPGSTYRVEVTTNLLPVIQWTILTNMVPASTPATFIDNSLVNSASMRFYRVLKP
jgi:subtilisin-like proprotein convertase family protein